VPEPAEQHSFHTTRWSLVARAGGQGEASRQALGDLLGAYWPPLYAWLRRQGHGAEDAQDLVQGLFARLIEKQELARIDVSPERGRFRAFLLTALRHFAANERKKATAGKRGGGVTLLRLDAATLALVEADLGDALTSAETPESHYVRQWATTVIETALRRMAAEFAARGRTPVFERIRGFLDAEPDRIPYATIARDLGTTEGAIKVAVHRLRARFRTVLRDEVAQTLDHEDQVDDELSVLLAAFRP
jgi:RNA polymerase sigma factor (sigma-70 family)